MRHSGATKPQDRAQAEIEQKYLTFLLGEEEYGIPVLQVAEIVKIEKLIQIPHSREYFLGLMDIRGRVLPIVQLKAKLAIQDEAGAARRAGDRAIITVINGRRIGLAVDQVSRVDRFPPENVDPGPPSLKSAASKFVTGVGKNHDEFVVLLNLEHLFTEDELAGLFTAVSGVAS
jgi:purine-binding chemotaxis protein CheW